jgi:Cu/Ag efflux pump CusA
MIVNGTISTDDIADDQISEAKIADDAVGQDQLKSVVNLQILNSSGGVLKSYMVLVHNLTLKSHKYMRKNILWQ